MAGKLKYTICKTPSLCQHNVSFDAYRQAVSQFTVHNAYIMNTTDAPLQIDTAITECITKVRRTSRVVDFDILMA
jgi:TPP-dependent 2-oxoacid decarboxylase